MFKIKQQYIAYRTCIDSLQPHEAALHIDFSKYKDSTLEGPEIRSLFTPVLCLTIASLNKNPLVQYHHVTNTDQVESGHICHLN